MIWNRAFMFSCLMAFAFSWQGCGNSAEEPEMDADKQSSESENAASTPEKTFQAAKKAAQAHDYQMLCGYFTDDAKKTLSAGMVMMAGLLQSAANAPDESDVDDAELAMAKAIKTVLEKHGLVEGKIPEVNINLNSPKEERDKELQKLADPIKDRCQFFADIVAAMREGSDNQDAKMMEDDAHLEGLKIEGDAATAEFVQTREPRVGSSKKTDGKTKRSERRSPIAFQKVDGRWLISEIPNLLN